MNILLLEDRGGVSFYLEEALLAAGHKVFPAFNVNDAKSFWGRGDIECIIADLNMSPEGLTKDEIEQTKAGILTGWIWLREHVFKNNDAMRARTIIYSEYLDYLDAAVTKGICLIPKRGSTNPTTELLKHVKTISQKLQKDNR